MKKILLIIALMAPVTAFGVVWENDPSFTPEQREQAKQTNANIREKNAEREALKNKEIAAATDDFMNKIEAIKAKYQPLVG